MAEYTGWRSGRFGEQTSLEQLNVEQDILVLRFSKDNGERFIAEAIRSGIVANETYSGIEPGEIAVPYSDIKDSRRLASLLAEQFGLPSSEVHKLTSGLQQACAGKSARK